MRCENVLVPALLVAGWLLASPGQPGATTTRSGAPTPRAGAAASARRVESRPGRRAARQVARWNRPPTSAAFAIPSGAHVVELGPGSLDLAFPAARRNPHYYAELVQIGARIRGRFGRAARAEVALYPLAGTDAAMPFVVLPGLRTSVAIDHRGFLRALPAPGSRIRPTADVESEWRNHGAIANDAHGGMLGARVLGALRSSFPDFELRRLTVFRTEERITDQRLEPAVHAIVEFVGGGVVRRHVQLQLGLADAAAPARGGAPTPLAASVAALAPDVVFVKAANGHFYDNPRTRGRVLRLARRGRALVIEGRHRTAAGKAWELSGRPGRIRGARALRIDSRYFSYGAGLQVHAL